MEITFYKYQGTGNDFVLFDNRTGSLPTLEIKTVRNLCDRNFGVGADGFIILQNKEGYDFEMIYYNADGSVSTMCGNGGRCMVQFAHDLGLHKTEYKFWAIDGEHIATMGTAYNGNDKIVRLKMQDVHAIDSHATYAVLNTGSPHYVKIETDVRHLNVVEEGAAIRYSSAFEDTGVNVNFVESTGPYSIYVRTYERGVEAETLSCGTGVTAAALLCAHNDRGFNEVQVQTNGGKLSVEFNKEDEENFTEIYLCGPAKFVFSGVIKI
jgi:diaminopimelate epimerase